MFELDLGDDLDALLEDGLLDESFQTVGAAPVPGSLKRSRGTSLRNTPTNLDLGQKRSCLDTSKKTMMSMSTKETHYKSSGTSTTVLHPALKSEFMEAESGAGSGGSGSLCQDISKKSKRKFPGPAGILPSSHATSFSTSKELIISTAPPISKEPGIDFEAGDLQASQSQPDDVFQSSQWKALVADLGPNAMSTLEKFSIKSILIKASRKLLPKGKVPLIMGVLESLDMQGADASFIIRDVSGRMNGALHRDLIKDPTSALQAGCVLILRQVSVISPSMRTHYLNVTPVNIVLTYNAKKDNTVSKEPWASSNHPCQQLSNGLANKMPSLTQIVEESSRELDKSTKDLHRYVKKSTFPLGSNPGSSRFHLFSSPVRFCGGLQGTPDVQRAGYQYSQGAPASHMPHAPCGTALNSNTHARDSKNRNCNSEASGGLGHSAVSRLMSDSLNRESVQPSTTPVPQYVMSGQKAVRASNSMNGEKFACDLIMANAGMRNTSSTGSAVYPEGKSVNSEPNKCLILKSSTSLLNECDEYCDNDMGFPDDDDSEFLELCDNIMTTTAAIPTNVHDRVCFSEPGKETNTNVKCSDSSSESKSVSLISCDKKRFSFKRNTSTQNSPMLPMPLKYSRSADNKDSCVMLHQKPLAEVQNSSSPLLDPVVTVYNPGGWNRKTSGSSLNIIHMAPTHSEESQPRVPFTSKSKLPMQSSVFAERNSVVELSKSVAGVMTSRDKDQAGHLATSWSDDLNDDFLLSQLSEEF